MLALFIIAVLFVVSLLFTVHTWRWTAQVQRESDTWSMEVELIKHGVSPEEARRFMEDLPPPDPRFDAKEVR